MPLAVPSEASLTALRAMGFVLPEENPSPDDVRATLTCLNTLRGLKLRSDPDLTPIILPWKGEIPLSDQEIGEVLVRMIKDSRIDVEAKYTRLLETVYHVTNSAGPCGPALLSAPLELPHIGLYLQAFHDLGRPVEPDLLEAFLQDWNDDVKPTLGSDGKRRVSECALRKLAAVPDKEGKMRVVAILDY